MGTVTEGLRASLTQAPAQRETGDPLAERGVAVSIGSATGRGGEATAGALLHAADRSMYRQKGWRP